MARPAYRGSGQSRGGGPRRAGQRRGDALHRLVVVSGRDEPCLIWRRRQGDAGGQHGGEESRQRGAGRAAGTIEIPDLTGGSQEYRKQVPGFLEPERHARGAQGLGGELGHLGGHRVDPRVHLGRAGAQRGQARGGGQGVPRQRARLVDGPQRGHHVHHLPPPAQARPPKGPAGSPPPIPLPNVIRSPATPSRPYQPDLVTRNPVSTSSMMSSEPCSAASAASTSLNPGSGGTTPMFAGHASVIRHAIPGPCAANTPATAAVSLYGSPSVWAAAARGPRGLSGRANVAPPDPAAASSASTCPW